MVYFNKVIQQQTCQSIRSEGVWMRRRLASKRPGLGVHTGLIHRLDPTMLANVSFVQYSNLPSPCLRRIGPSTDEAKLHYARRTDLANIRRSCQQHGLVTLSIFMLLPSPCLRRTGPSTDEAKHYAWLAYRPRRPSGDQSSSMTWSHCVFSCSSSRQIVNISDVTEWMRCRPSCVIYIAHSQARPLYHYIVYDKFVTSRMLLSAFEPLIGRLSWDIMLSPVNSGLLLKNCIGTCIDAF